MFSNALSSVYKTHRAYVYLYIFDQLMPMNSGYIMKWILT